MCAGPDGLMWASLENAVWPRTTQFFCIFQERGLNCGHQLEIKQVRKGVLLLNELQVSCSDFMEREKFCFINFPMHALGYNFLSEYVLFRLKQNFGNFDSYLFIWWNAYWLSLVKSDKKKFGSWSIRHDLEPNNSLLALLSVSNYIKLWYLLCGLLLYFHANYMKMLHCSTIEIYLCQIF